jgi:hypothetical protein
MGGYFGSKATCGLRQPIIALMPPHDTYIETLLGGGAIMQRKAPAIESNGYPWARHLKRLLKETRAKVAERDNKHLTEAEYKKLRKRYRTILTQGAKQLPPLPPRKKGSRGRLAKSDAHNLWERFKHYEDAKLPHVPFTNNRAERDSRMSKVKQKLLRGPRGYLYAARVYRRLYLRLVPAETTAAYLESIT